MIDEIQQILDSLPKPQPKEEPRTLNAYRHGLTGHVRFYTPADERAYKKHCEGYLDTFDPIGPVERDLAQAVADGRWRIKRAAQIENAIVAITLGQPDQMKCDVEEAAVAFAQAQAWLERGKDLNLLTLYERRLQRAFQEDFKLLQQLQERRLQRELASRPASAATRTRLNSPAPAPQPQPEPELDFSNRPQRPAVTVSSPPGIAA
jgi:hypothetical protein